MGTIRRDAGGRLPMNVTRKLSLLPAVLALALPVRGIDLPASKEYYYGIEINGTLCGHARFVTSPLLQDGKEVLLLKHTILMRLTALGSRVESRLDLTYHIDPATGRFTYHDSTIEQGEMRLFSKIRIEGARAFISGSGGNQEKEAAVPLPPNVVLANTLYYPHLIEDFVVRKLDARTYPIFDGRDVRVQETTFTKAGTETIRRRGKTYETIVLDSLNKWNGMKSKLWLDTATGIAVQVQHPNRFSYLAEPSIVQAATTANVDTNILSRTNISIPNVKEISYMKVRAVIDPTGLWVSPEMLNVPGQRFTGTVRDNLVEGEFEIEHCRYDGSKAPAFPPDFSRDPAMKDHLEASELIQADDPVLVEKAREITKGSRDCWEAARRLSRWVGENIEGAIPGGGTARGTYDARSGECGGHSFLLAAFCRAVGIPARVVWGCMYSPSGGGAFGQHAWNEIFMGEAGWIPVDSTIQETDYVDSGHIRIGIHKSTTTALNAHKMEILDYRIGHADSAASATIATATYREYVGEYTHVDRGTKVNFSVKDGALVLDIPGKITLAFKEPDTRGVWQSTISDRLFATFERNNTGEVEEVRLHEVVRLRRTGDSDHPLAEVPADYQPYPGKYLLAQRQAEFVVLYENESLAVRDPLAKKTVRLQNPDNEGKWLDEFKRNTIQFEKDDAGKVSAMVIDAVSRFRR